MRGVPRRKEMRLSKKCYGKKSNKLQEIKKRFKRIGCLNSWIITEFVLDNCYNG